MISLYLSGPIDKVNLRSARRWREHLRVTLELLGYTIVNPLDKYGDDLTRIRRTLRRWQRDNKEDKIREYVSKEIIDKDLKAVQQSDVLIVYIPKNGSLCGTYGEVTFGYYLHKPIYVVTERDISELHKWLIGCSTMIFYSFEDLVTFLKEHKDKIIKNIKNNTT